MSILVRGTRQAIGAPAHLPALPPPVPALAVRTDSGLGTALQQLAEATSQAAVILAQRRRDEDDLWAHEQFARYQTSIAEQIAELQNRALADPTADANRDIHLQIDELQNRAREQFLSETLGARRLDAQVESRLRGQLTAHGLRTTLQGQEVERQRHASATMELLEGAAERMANEVISNPNLLATRREALGQLIAQNREALGAAAPRFARQASRTLEVAALTGLVQRDPGGMMRRLNSGEFDERIGPNDKMRLLSAAEREIEARQRRAEAAARRAEAEAARVFNQIHRDAGTLLDAAAKNRPIPPEHIEMLREQAATLSGEAGQMARAVVEQTEAILPELIRFGGMDDDAQFQVLARQRELIRTAPDELPEDLRNERAAAMVLHDAFETVHATSQRERAAYGPVDSAVLRGEIETQLPADPSDPQWAAQAERNYNQYGETVGRKAAAAMAEQAESLPPMEWVGAMQGYATTLTPGAFLNFTAQIGQDAPALQAAAQVSAANPAAATQIITGHQRLEALQRESPTEVADVVRALGRHAAAIGADPQAQKRALDASMAHWLGGLGAEMPERVDQTGVKRSFEAIYGTPFTVKGTSLVPPDPRIEGRNDFHRMLTWAEQAGRSVEKYAVAVDHRGRSLGPAVPLHGNGDPVSWRDLRDDVQFRPLGVQGLYHGVLRGGEKVVSADGLPIVFDFRELPGEYLGSPPPPVDVLHWTPR